MEKIEYPNKGMGRATDQKIESIRSYLNELADVLNHNFEQIEEELNRLSKEEE